MSEDDPSDERMGGLTPDDVAIDILGRCLLPSPVAGHLGERGVHFVGAAGKVLLDDALSSVVAATADAAAQPAFELAGPRDKIFFDPRTVRCGIVTCGGLAPGLDNVVRGIGLVKLMGRHSGFLACQAALASTEADLVLIPEVTITLDGDLWMSVIEATGQPRAFA